MPRPPPGARPPISFSPVLPQNRGPPAIQLEIGSLLAEIKKLKVGHAEDLRARDKENHYLRCQLGAVGADHLRTFDKLMVNDEAEGWTSFDDLPVLKNMSPAEVEQEIKVRGYGHRLVYDPKHPPPKKDFATGRSFYSRESYFRDLLEELRNKAYGAAIPSKEYVGPPLSNSPFPVGATRNHPPNRPTKKGTFGPNLPPPLDVNHFLTTGTKQKPVDQVAMQKTVDQIFRPKISPPPGIPIDKKSRSSSMPVASGSSTHVAPAPVPTASSINLSEGRTLNVNVSSGENDPAKKPPPANPKKKYNKIVNWWEGCPYCDDIPKSYNSYRQHVSYRCKNRPNQTE